MVTLERVDHLMGELDPVERLPALDELDGHTARLGNRSRATRPVDDHHDDGQVGLDATVSKSSGGGVQDLKWTNDTAYPVLIKSFKAGGSITFHEFEGQPHAFIPRDPAAPAALRALGLITDFIHHQTR